MKKQKQDEPTREFITESLPISAALLALGCEFSGATRRTSSRHEFHFPDPKAAELAGQYVQGKLLLDPQKFMVCFDDLRTVVRRGA